MCRSLMGVIMEKSAGKQGGDRAALGVRAAVCPPSFLALVLSKFSVALQLYKRLPQARNQIFSDPHPRGEKP